MKWNKKNEYGEKHYFNMIYIIINFYIIYINKIKACTNINKNMNNSFNSDEKDICHLNSFINTLPIELVNIIITYTYQLKTIDFQKDIISYVNSKCTVIQLFEKRNYTLFLNDKNIIYNHLMFHTVSFMRGLVNLYINCGHFTLNHILKRHPWLNKDYFLKKLIIIDKNSYFNKIKFGYLWALLSIEERENFITIQKSF